LLPELDGDFVDKLRRPLPLVPPTAKTNRCHNSFDTMLLIITKRP